MPIGGHEVAFRAQLPGALPISTPSLLVELMCDPDPDRPLDEDSSDGGCASTRSGSSSALIVLGFAALRRRRRR
jgi:uncharacterized protein (TIGR03382 family)